MLDEKIASALKKFIASVRTREGPEPACVQTPLHWEWRVQGEKGEDPRPAVLPSSRRAKHLHTYARREDLAARKHGDDSPHLSRNAPGQKYDQFLRERQIAYMIYEYFRLTGAHEAVHGLSDLFSKSLQDDDVRDFDTRWDQAPWAASEIPTETVLEGLYKSKCQDSVQRHTVLAMHEQEDVRNNEPPNYSRLKTTVRRHIDQTMRTHNFRARSEIVWRGAVSKSQKGRKVSVERKVGECYHWKAIGQCSKGDSCSFIHDLASGNRRDQSPLLRQIRRPRLTESNHPKGQASGGKSFWKRRSNCVPKFP